MRSPQTVLIIAALALAGLDPAGAECTTLKSTGKRLGESIGLVSDPAVAPEWIDQAIEYWSSCSNYGHDFPLFVHGRAAAESRTITIRYEMWSQTRRCASFQGPIITLYASAAGEGRPRSCRNMAQNLAHELGHVLGLNDADDDNRCRYHIMGWITPRKPFRAVHPEECRSVGQRWLTPMEREAVAGSP